MATTPLAPDTGVFRFRTQGNPDGNAIANFVNIPESEWGSDISSRITEAYMEIQPGAMPPSLTFIVRAASSAGTNQILGQAQIWEDGQVEPNIFWDSDESGTTGTSLAVTVRIPAWLLQDGRKYHFRIHTALRNTAGNVVDRVAGSQGTFWMNRAPDQPVIISPSHNAPFPDDPDD